MPRLVERQYRGHSQGRESNMARARLLWILCVVAGLAMIAAMVAMGQVPHQVACDGNASLRPILRFEWLTSAAQFQQFFGAEPCRSQLALAMDGVDRIDTMAYIPAFTLFQLFAAFAMRANGRLAALFVINAALIAAGCDLLEDHRLFSLSAIARMREAIEPAGLEQLFWFVRVKFGLLALAAIALGRLVGARSGKGWRITSWAMMGSGAVGLAGLVMPQLLAPGIGAAWALLFGVALVRVVRPQAA
ncbi:MAG: hypothetical protein ABL909_00550 [Sphingopyxis sp.]